MLLAAVMFIGCSKEDEQVNQLQEEMILIPSGSVMIGEDSQYSFPNQKPVHKVHLDAYYVDVAEVTNSQYREFIRDGGYKRKEFWTKEGWAYLQKALQGYRPVTPWSLARHGFNKPHQPVCGVVWYEADAYARWCGKRLPTEAEWERAARSTDGRIYPWGDEFDYTKVYYGLAGTFSVNQVGSYPNGASADGLLDMSGSVWEWVADWYSGHYYLDSPSKNPSGPSRGHQKVLRGGAWGPNRLQWKATYRYSEKPNVRRFDVGFRCARNGS